MAYTITKATEPTQKALDLQFVKDYLRVDNNDEDVLINSLITAAKNKIEHMTGRVLISTTFDIWFPCFYDVMVLPKNPITAISYVKYYDAANTLQTLSSSYYDYNLDDSFPEIKAAYNYTYPNTYDRAKAVNVRFVAGWTQATIPEDLRIAMLLIVGHYFENRQNVVVGRQVNELPQAAESLANSYKIYSWK